MKEQRYHFTVDDLNYDCYPRNFLCWVRVWDHKTNRRFKRRGYGRFIGNFSPIWITINKIHKQLTEWEREEI